MPRVKKDNVPVSFKLATDVYDRLEEYCKESGQSKTVAVERAITSFIDEYEKRKPAAEG